MFFWLKHSQIADSFGYYRVYCHLICLITKEVSMKKLALIVSVASLGLAANALAGHQEYATPATNNAWYAGINGGVELPVQAIDQDAYADLGAQIGYRMNNWRLEEGYNYYFSTRGNALMTNGYYDFRNSSKFTPYVGLGAGWFNVQPTNSLAFQGILGVDYQLCHQMTLGVNYRYINWIGASANGLTASNTVNLVLNRYF